MTLLTAYLLALIHMKIPIKIKIKHFQFSNSLLSQCFRLLLLFLHDWSSVNDRSWEMFMSVCSSWVAAGTGETSTLKKSHKKCDFIFQWCESERKKFLLLLSLLLVHFILPISPCSTLSSSPAADLWMHLNLLLWRMTTIRSF